MFDTPTDARRTPHEADGRSGRHPYPMPEEPITDPTPEPTPAAPPTPAKAEPAPAAPVAADAPATAEETVTKAEHTREMDRLRNELGQFRKRAKELEDAQKTEAERLAEKAALADKLGPEVESLKAALAAEVEERRKALPKEMLDLLPDGSAPEQLAWIRKAQAAAEKLKPAPSPLPAAGGRNPGGTAEGASTAIKREQALADFPSLQRRKFLNPIQ